MILHKSKAYRCILELSFQIRLKQKLFKLVNTQTKKHAKAETMVQLEIALQSLSPPWYINMNLRYLSYSPRSTSNMDSGAWALVTRMPGIVFNVLPLLNPVDSIDDIELVVPNSL